MTCRVSFHAWMLTKLSEVNKTCLKSYRNIDRIDRTNMAFVAFKLMVQDRQLAIFCIIFQALKLCPSVLVWSLESTTSAQ